MEALSALLLALLLPANAAQTGAESVPASAVPPADALDLTVRLEPGFIWRQSVRFETSVTQADGSSSEWSFDYKLRLRCADADAQGFSVEGQFIDWRLQLQNRQCRFTWSDGHFEAQNMKDGGELPASPACRRLLRAWSAGIRDSFLAFHLRPDGSVESFEGLESLHRVVHQALTDGKAELPAEIEIYFGEDGLQRADTALAMALSVPRPLRPVAPGATWEHHCTVAGLTPTVCRVRRIFELTGVGRERRYRFATATIQPRFWIEDGKGGWKTVEDDRTPPGEHGVRILLDNGLLYSSDLALDYPMEDGSRATFHLASHFYD